jgi:DNA replication protein DnaC
MLVLAGKPGCGKTYLCSAIIDWINGKVSSMYFHREAKFMEKVRSSFDMKGDYHGEIEYLLDHDFVILDDLGSTGSGPTQWRKEVIFSMIDNRYSSKRPTVVSTNLNPQEMFEFLGERTKSRIMDKNNVYINMFDYPDLRMPLQGQKTLEELEKK